MLLTIAAVAVCCESILVFAVAGFVCPERHHPEGAHMVLLLVLLLVHINCAVVITPG